MNNIEIKALKNDLKKYFYYTEEQLENIHRINEVKLSSLKTLINKFQNEEYEKKKSITKKIYGILPTKAIISDSAVKKSLKVSEKEVVLNNNGKPNILLISDVKGWAWWIKSEYLKKYLSDDFNIDIKCVIGPGSVSQYKINQLKYNLYFTYGFSYISMLSNIPKNKKITGVTAHRAKNVILPKMKMAGHHHANSVMLLNELKDMGFTNAYYVPNGVDEKLFKIIKPIKKDGNLIVGHVGKECAVKGQREYILPAIKKAGVKSYTNLRNWKDKIPHNKMPEIYQEMDVFVVASTEDGTPNPALEAAACGRPIISNKIGNMPQFIKDGYNGFIVPRKIEAYVEKINYFKNNRSELIRMGNNARKTIEEDWTWEKQSERYRKMFHDILGR